MDYQFEWSYSSFERDLANYSRTQLEVLEEFSMVKQSAMSVATVTEAGMDIPAAIEDHVRDRRADLCMIGRCDCNRVGAFSVGSTAEKLIHHLGVPLLLISAKLISQFD